jgi:transposase
MKTIDLTGLAPEVTEYISKLELQLNVQTTQLKEQETQLQDHSKTVESMKVRIDRLMDMLAKFQKSMFGQSSEKSKFVLGEETNQLSLFNEADRKSVV